MSDGKYHDDYDEEGFIIKPDTVIVKSNLKILKKKIKIKEMPNPLPDDDPNQEVVYDESTMNHENLGTYQNNFYRKVFIPSHLESYDLS